MCLLLFLATCPQKVWGTQQDFTYCVPGKATESEWHEEEKEDGLFRGKYRGGGEKVVMLGAWGWPWVSVLQSVRCGGRCSISTPKLASFPEK